MVIEDGFPGQRLLVLPRPLADRALSQPVTSRLLVTDCGFFPKAHAHGIDRSQPIPQAVVLVCTDGVGWCTVGSTTHIVRAGQVAVVPPGATHAYGSDEDDPWTLWWMHLDGRDLPELLHSTGALGSAPVQTLTDPYRAVALIEEIVQRMGRDLSQASLVAAAGAAWHFLTVLATDAQQHTSRRGVVEQAKDYLHAHVAERVSVTDLASVARLSPSHFAALFRAEVGVPVLQYHSQLRMARARALLDTTDLSIAQIAGSVGYLDPFYFSRQFKKLHGITAARYRAQAKG